MNIIDIQNATVYRGENLALERFSLTLPFGEHHAILGGNGAGKTSFLKLIMRELHPVVTDDSYIRVLDQEHPTIWDVRDNLGVVSQDFQEDYRALATGLDVVLSGFFGSVGIHQHLQVTDAQRQQARALMERLNIDALAARQYLELSTGQQRRLVLARALIHKPKALILDEPTNGLDLSARFWFLRTIRELAQSGTTIILVTHDPLEIIPEISKVTILKQGRIVCSGDKDEVITERNMRDAYGVPIAVHTVDGYYHMSPQ